MGKKDRNIWLGVRDRMILVQLIEGVIGPDEFDGTFPFKVKDVPTGELRDLRKRLIEQV